MNSRKIVKGMLGLGGLVWITLTGGLWAQSQNSVEKITLALAEFENRTDLFFYDRLQKTIPEMLKTDISRYSDIIVLERSKLDAILAEQALAQTGLIDPKTAQTVGRLIGAQFVISGEISKTNNRLRIDAHILQVASGQLVGEKVSGSDMTMIDDMMAVLANNIVFSLTGKGARIEKKAIRRFPSRWLLLSGAATGLGAWFSHTAFNDHYDNYKSARQLSEIESNYSQANRAYKNRNLLIGTSSTLLITGAVFYFLDHREHRMILARSKHGETNFYLALLPDIDLSKSIGVRLCLGF